MGKGKIRWEASSDGNFPSASFRGGFDDDDPLLVIRSDALGGLIPGKFHVSHDKGYIPFDGKENPVSNYEVLTAEKGALKWEPSSGGQVVTNALQGGKTAEGEPLYIGRVSHLNTLTVGKVHLSHGVCYAPYDGEELSFAEYEILVTTKPHRHRHCHWHGHWAGRRHRRGHGFRRRFQRRRSHDHESGCGKTVYTYDGSGSSSSSSDSE